MMRVGVIGGAGFVGGELLRLLHAHPEVGEVTACSRSRAGQSLADVHPSLAGIDATFSGDAPEDVAKDRDVVFLCSENGQALSMAAGVLSAGPRLVCDLSADFRIRDEAVHARTYGERPEAAREIASRFVYALADVSGPELRGATALAVPGCFATAAQLVLRPLARLAPVDAPVVFAITGSSGAGAKLKETTHHPLRAHNLFAYASMSHRHEAEIAERWRLWTGRDEAPRLMAHAGPFVRGIYLTLHARLARPVDAPAAYRDAYRARRFVRVLEAPPSWLTSWDPIGRIST